MTKSSGSAISGHAPADRYVMGLLRACADVGLIGAGTLRATPGHLWTPAHACPAAADGYAALRRALGRDGAPLLAVVTARGDLPAGHPALHAGGLPDELSFTISPLLPGRGDTARPGLVAGLELLPGRAQAAELLTIRRHRSCLFLPVRDARHPPVAGHGG